MTAGDLTVVVLTRNEGARIAGALRRLPRDAAVFVLDAESDDDTVAVARALGATVECRAWSGFIGARRYALQRVTTAWTLFLDADERLDESLVRAIEAADGDGVDGYALRRATALCGAPVRACGWSDEWILRLVRTAHAGVVGSGRAHALDVHERITVPGPVGRLTGTIVHDSYPTIGSYRTKFDRYTDIEAVQPRRDGPALALALVAIPLRFAWGYLRWRAWRDGWRGAFVAWHSARYQLVVSWKSWRRA